MARTPRSERLFVALDLPEAVREGVAAWRDELLFHETQQLRRVDTQQLHVTLAFLGWQEAGAADGIAAAGFGGAERMAAPAPVLRAAGVRAVPLRAPRLLALDLEDEGGHAAELHRGVSAALEAFGVYRPEKRPFWPHITLARVRRGVRFKLSPPAGQDIGLNAPPEPFEASALTLYRSTLRPQGALYEPLARLPLGGEKPSGEAPSL